MSADLPVNRNKLMPVLLAGCYGLGVAHWLYMFANPHGPGWANCTGADWTLASDYFDILRAAVHDRQWPWLMDFSHYSNRFLGLPETPLSPQYVLALFVPNALFNVFNLLFLFTCCFAGLVLIQREYRLSPIPFLFLFLLYNFNGYIVSRVSAGHFMWFGYFFMPFMHWCVLRMARGNCGTRVRILFAFGFLVLLLQGSFHLFVWWTLYLGLLALLHPNLIRPVAGVLILAFGLGLFRFLPGVVSLWNTSLSFTTGYPGLGGLLDGLTEIRRIEWIDTSRHFGDLGWWEFDCYIGIAAFLLLGYFGVVRAFRGNAEGGHRALDFASLAMALLCFGDILGALGMLPVPLFSSQRVASRLIIVPLTTCMVLAALRMEQELRARPKDLPLRLLLALFLAATLYDLYEHTSTWKVTRMDEYFGSYSLYPHGARLVRPDWTQPGMRLYAWSVVGGGVLSGMFLVGSVFLFWKGKRLDDESAVELASD